MTLIFDFQLNSVLFFSSSAEWVTSLSLFRSLSRSVAQHWDTNKQMCKGCRQRPLALTLIEPNSWRELLCRAVQLLRAFLQEYHIKRWYLKILLQCREAVRQLNDVPLCHNGKVRSAGDSGAKRPNQIPGQRPRLSPRDGRRRSSCKNTENNVNLSLLCIFPPWKPEHRCYFCGPGCAEVGGAGPQRVLVNTQLSQCDVGDMMCDVGARKTAETGLSGLSGAGWLTVFHGVCAISGNSNLFCLMNMMQRHWGGFHGVWLFTGTTLCILKYLHDWPRSLLPDCSQAGVIMTVLTGWWLSE